MSNGIDVDAVIIGYGPVGQYLVRLGWLDQTLAQSANELAPHA